MSAIAKVVDTIMLSIILAMGISVEVVVLFAAAVNGALAHESVVACGGPL